MATNDARRRDAADVEAAARFASFAQLDDEETKLLLSFAMSMKTFAVVSAVSTRFREVALTPGAWQGTVVTLRHPKINSWRWYNFTRRLVAFMERVADHCWSQVAEVQLPPHHGRVELAARIQTKFPKLPVSVSLPLNCGFFFIYGNRHRIQLATGKHGYRINLRSDRYKWMAKRLFAGPEPHRFGFMQRRGDKDGGGLVDVISHRMWPDGSYDVLVKLKAWYHVLEGWAEAVPDAPPRRPPLYVAYVRWWEDGEEESMAEESQDDQDRESAWDSESPLEY